MNDNEGRNIALIVCSVVIILASLVYLFVRLDRVEVMSVRSKEWYREVKELDDYQTEVCKTTYIKVGDMNVPQTNCHWETRTRTITIWPTSGAYPSKPQWFEGYVIRTNLGYYEGRYERYIIHLSDDKRIWDYSVNNEGWYDTFPVKGKCKVGLNWFSIIIKVMC